MNRYQSMVGAAIAGLMLTGLMVICADRKAPEAPGHAMAQEFDAGQIVVDLPYELKHRFEFRNDTEHTIEIAKIATSCGCTGADAPVRSLAPGESGWIDATALLHATGQFGTQVTISWSTGEQTHFALGAFAQVSRMLSLSTVSLDLNVDEPRSILLTYIDQKGTPPGPVQLDASGALDVTIGEWKTIIPANEQYGIPARYSAAVDVGLNTPIDRVGHVSFSLESFPQVRPAQLAIRTPALVKAYAIKHRPLRQSTGPITIEHASESSTEPPSEAPVLPKP